MGTAAGIAGAIVNTVVRALAELRPPSPNDREYDDNGRVPGPVADAIFDAAAETLGEHAIGLVVARRIAPGALGLLDYALFASESWGDAIRRVSQFYSVATERVTMTIEEEGDEARIVLTREAGYRQNRHWVEFSFGVIVERARQGIGGPFKVRSVDFAHAAPPERAMHERYFGATVRFDQPTDRLVFDRALLGAKLRTAASALAASLEQRLAELLPVTHDAAMIRVREVIAAQLDAGEVTLEGAAAALEQSPRSLQRWLQQHGVAFKTLVDEMRRDRALVLLRTSGLPVAEIAERIGFADPSAFIRAFRRWTGTTPSAVRAANEPDE